MLLPLSLLVQALGDLIDDCDSISDQLDLFEHGYLDIGEICDGYRVTLIVPEH